MLKRTITCKTVLGSLRLPRGLVEGIGLMGNRAAQTLANTKKMKIIVEQGFLLTITIIGYLMKSVHNKRCSEGN